MGNVVGAQLRDRLVERPGGEPLFGEAQDDVEVLRTFLGAGEPRVARQLGLPQHRAEAVEEVLGGRGEHESISDINQSRKPPPLRGVTGTRPPVPLAAPSPPPPYVQRQPSPSVWTRVTST